MKTLLSLSLALAILLTSCSLVVPPATSSPTAISIPTKTPAPSATPFSTPTRAPTWTPFPDQTQMPNANSPYTIWALRQRKYGGGQVEVTQKTYENKFYKRYIIRYPSDELNIYGYAYVPKGRGPFPVIIMLHGHSDPEDHNNLTQDTDYAEMYASNGYIVLHPNLRNYWPSDHGDNRFLAGMAVDVLNLIALIKTGTGQDGIFKQANPDRLGLWAFSMGGAIALKVLTVSHDVDAAFLYSPMSGDDYLNAQFLAKVGDADAQLMLTFPLHAFMGTSAQYFYKDITAAVDIHHGTIDSVIPLKWSQNTCQQLTNLGKTVNCYYYEGEEHIFDGNGGVKLKLRMRNFFHTHLKAPPKATPTP